MIFAGLPRQLESIAQNAIRTVAREHRHLRSKLMVGARVHPPADLRIFAFDIFADDPHINIAGAFVTQRRRNAGQEPHRAQVHILIELAPDRDQQLPQRDMIRHTGKAHRTKEDRIMIAQLVDAIIRHHLTRRLERLARPIEWRLLDLKPMQRRHCIKNFQSFGHRLIANPVTGQHRNLVGLGHQSNPAHTNIFHFHVIIEAVLRSFPPDAAFFHAAKGCDLG